MNSSLISIESVTKRYGQVLAVDRVSLSISGGEIFALVGANGAGKSTLIRVMTGLAAPDSGTVSICGEQLSQTHQSVKRHIGYLPEELTFYDRLSGREYLELVAGLKGADLSQLDEEIEFFELTEVADKWAGEYSLGMRKKLGLASAFIGRPQVLVLDEPLNGLDVEMMRKLRLRIEDQRRLNRCVLVSSHIMSFVERISDRVGVMRGGSIVALGSPNELRQLAGMSEAAFEDVFFYLAG